MLMLSFLALLMSGPAPAAAPTVVVDGSSTVYRISKAAQEGFDEVDPKVQVIVNSSGTGGGFGKYLQGEVDIVDASRPAKPAEESSARAKGLVWAEYTVGYDGITVVVNPKNTFVKSLSVKQLKTLWEPDSKVTTWHDLDPSWPARRIVLYSPDNDSGTFEYFTEAVVGKAKAQRRGVQQNADDNALVKGVTGDADAIGYFGYAYYVANRRKLSAVPIKDGDKPAVLPAESTILDKSYSPLSRPLYIYVKNSSMKRPEVAKFVGYYLANAAKLAKQAKYVPPTAADLAANAARLAGGPR